MAIGVFDITVYLSRYKNHSIKILGWEEVKNLIEKNNFVVFGF